MTRTTGAAVALLVAGAAGVAALQPGLARTVHAVKESGDVVAFPPPDELRVAVLGWDAAAVDLLWAKLLVEYGVHFSERRDFTEIPRYLDAILALEPGNASLYKYVDTMLVYRPMQGTEEDARLARAYLERGTRERPLDPQIWLRYGQFVAFIGPSFLKDKSEVPQWHQDGALAMAHAGELGADQDDTLAAASMLNRAGSTREAIKYLERAYVFTEHPAMHEVHEAIGKRLEALSAVSMRDAADAVAQAIEERREREMPALSHTEYLLLGPAIDPARCAGIAALDDRLCARSWDEATAGRGSSANSP
ncbi:MAG TPA: hypothetical protein VHV30_06170 [Polyangiaceae bacterium]|jgi:tetratricopeptide (TPR) repeat protein|nr:hypothetical protein [Polyangiaceae bacterium]